MVNKYNPDYIILLPPTTKLGQGYIFTGVCNSVHRGGVHGWGPAWLRGACVLGGMCGLGACMAGGVCGGGHAWLGGSCMVGDVYGGGHAWQGGVHDMHPTMTPRPPADTTALAYGQ